MSKFSRRQVDDDSSDADDSMPSEKSDRLTWLPPPLRGRRGWLWAGLALLVLVVGFGAWLGAEANTAKSSLEEARNNAQQSKDALLEADTEEALRYADNAYLNAQAARDATHSLPWSVAAVVPWLGGPFKTGQQISDVVLGLAEDVLRPTAEVGVTIAPDQLYKDGRVDVQLLREQQSQLRQISTDAERLNGQAQSISDPGYFSLLRDVSAQLQTQTSDVAGVLENTALAAEIAPSMMGADGPRSYFMGFQTNAEARGTGGLLGGFGVLRFDDGTPIVENLAPNTELKELAAPIDLGAEFNEMYGYTNPTSDVRNSNLSSHFPYAAQIWRSMWAQETGVSVDGVIAIDPVALSYILGAVGPVTMPDGERIDKDNVVELTESTAYIRFPEDQTARKNYLQDIANQVVKKITGPVESPRKLMDALGRAVGEGRIAVWSAIPEDQELLEKTPLAHIIPDDSAPYAEVVVNNLGGNKMDYYLDREIEYVADGCDGPTRNSTVTVRLRNTVSDPESLPEYIAGSAGLLSDLPFEAPWGTMVSSVRLIATQGASLVSALANGERVPVISGTERGHPTFEVQVLIPPGQSGELSFRLSEPTAPGAARVPVQPLVDDVTPVVSVPECSE